MAGAFLALVVRADNFLPSKFIKHAWISLDRGPAGVSYRSPSRKMGGILIECGGFGRICVSFAVFRTKMAPGCADEPIHRLHRNDQLCALPAAQYSVWYGSNAALGHVSVAGHASDSPRELRYGRSLLTPSREATPTVKAILRVEAGPEGSCGQPVCGRVSLKRPCACLPFRGSNTGSVDQAILQCG